MKVLIVDDSNAKISAISEILRGVDCGIEIESRRSFQAGLKALETLSFDLIILDMTIPTTEKVDGRPEGRTRFFGGRELLGEMDLLGCDTKVIIVTQFGEFDDGSEKLKYEDLIRMLDQDFGDIIIGSVFYSSISDGWMKEIERLILRS